MEDSSLQFAQPIWMLVGLLVCAGIIAVFVRFDRRRESDLAKIIHPRFRQRLTEGFSPWRRNLKRGLWLAAVALLFTAVARPQKGYEWTQVKRKGIDILFAVDTSRSMLAEDLTPNRLERAKMGITDFVERLESDRVGLIPFAGSAFALCPLTLDYDAFRESLDALNTELIPRQGTDLASAIKEAERLFDEAGNNHRILVLLTDGEDLQGSVVDAAKAAAKKGMSIYTVGVGSPDGATIPIRYQNGRNDFVRDEDGNVVRTKLDEGTLRKIAEQTEGLYVPLGRGAEGLNTIYQERLRLVPKSEMDQRMERIPLERFEWPLGAAVVLLLAEFFIGDRRRVKPVRALPSAARRMNPLPRVTPLLVFGMACSLGVVSSRASDAEDPRVIYNRGTEAYEKGDFNAASEALRVSLRTPDLTLQHKAYYNLGNTLYRTGQTSLEKDPDVTIKSWEGAVKAYDDALALNSADEDARFNKEWVAKKLKELKKQQQESQKNDPNKKDSEDQDKKDESKKDESKEDSKDSKDEEKKESDSSKESGDSKDGKEGGEEKPEDSSGKEEGEKPEQKGDQKGEDSQEEKPEEQEGEKPGEKKEPGEKEGKEASEESGEQEAGEVSEERGEKQEMTAEEARQLLESLKGDERQIIPIPQAPRGRLRSDNTTKGKTW